MLSSAEVSLTEEPSKTAASQKANSGDVNSSLLSLNASLPSGAGTASLPLPMLLNEPTGDFGPLPRDLADFDAAFICNSATPACAVTGIDGHAFPPAEAVIARLIDAWRSNPRQKI